MYQHWRILLLFLELVVFERIRSFIYPFLFPQLLIIAPTETVKPYSWEEWKKVNHQNSFEHGGFRPPDYKE